MTSSSIPLQSPARLVLNHHNHPPKLTKMPSALILLADGTEEMELWVECEGKGVMVGERSDHRENSGRLQKDVLDVE